MNILIITAASLRNDNSTGNTYINLFTRMNDTEFSNIYCNSQNPENHFVKNFFQITEKQIIASCLNSQKKVGIPHKNSFSDNSPIKSESNSVLFMKKHRFRIFFLVRDFIWKIPTWKNKNLDIFLEETKPDLIFAPLFAKTSLNDLIVYSKNHLNCKLITYAWDDEYTLNQFSFSPMFWIDRLYQRIAMKKTAKLSDLIYVISDKQKEVYDNCFDKNCKILTKGENFKDKPTYNSNEIIKFVYTGNLGYKRWKSLVTLGNILSKFNADSIKAQLYIYSQTALKKHVIDAMNIENTSFFKGKVSHGEAIEQQKSSDILLHVESFGLKARKQVRLSFSTKLVDYFHQAKCIFAVGPKEVASMDYLIKNDAAITATSEKEIEEKLKMIIENPDIIKEYGDKAWECGKKNHQIDKIQKMLKEDFENLIKSK